MARPKKQIDEAQFEKLCALQCTLEEVSSYFDCDADTIEAWCRRTYQKSFSAIFALKRGKGKVSLRRSQFRLAETNASMAIFLGKQYLSQTDVPAQTVDKGVQIIITPRGGNDED